ncbi:MAG TPA: tetratricopeptide repeat protein, partial [Nevskiaceae bacterium]|nr:tetratricopeptide repeat protein [Nevskiaceae bacterium]
MKQRAFLLGLTLALAACTPRIVKDAAPPIGDVVDKPKPDDHVLPIIPSEQIAVDPQKAADNYRKLLALTPDDKTQAESMRRLADLQVQMEDAKGNDAPESSKSLKEAIQLYNDLLYKQPNDPNNDRVFYQLARAYQNSGDMDAAIDTLQRLTTRYPNSDVAGDAHFRRAELLFARNRWAEAEAEYKTVMDLADATPFFQSAQYKYGWTRYKQANYEGAIETFGQILDRELPQGELYDPKAALDAVARNKSDLARDSLRVTSLSFAALGGGKAVNDYYAKHGDPRYFPLVYSALGDLELEKLRYTEGAETFAAFIERYPNDSHAPAFQSRVIKAYDAGGFHDLVAREKERYVTTYDPAAPYWHGTATTAAVMSELRVHLEDLARHYYARGQGAPKPAEGETAQPSPDFLVAAKWYRRTIELYPKDPQVAELNFMLGESLYNGGRTLDAAHEYLKTAYGYPLNRRSDEAAYAAVLALERYSKEVKPEERPAALKETIAASLKLADTFPRHPQVARVLTRSAEDLYELKDYDQAIAVAARVINFPREVDINLRRSVWSVTADSYFAQKKYPEAEKAYTQELALTARNTVAYGQVTEQL